MSIHPAGLVYIVVVGVFAPFVAVRSARRLADMPRLPSRAVLARSVFISYALMGVLSWWVARSIGIPWAVVKPLTARDVLCAAGALALLLAWAPIGWRTRPARERERLAGMLPDTPARGALWIAVSLGAGLFEEIAWRGVLFANVAWLVHSPWLAAGLCSISFGVAHAYQGPRGVVVTGIIALLMHALVALTGSLLAAMIVHFLYDAIAGFLFAAFARREGLLPPKPAA
jgi:membrane protease YdiL (CAAX protease family)